MVRGKPAKVPLETMKNLIMKYKHILYPNLPKRCDPIYRTLHEALLGKLSIDAIILTLKRNFNYLFDVKEKNPDSDELSVKDNQNSQVSSEHSSCLESDIENERPTSRRRSFSIFFDTQEWRDIQPFQYVLPRCDKTKPNVMFRTVTKLQRNKWTGLLREKIWLQSKNPCTWTFKKNIVYSNSDILCKGLCNQCDAMICVERNDTCLATENMIELKCTIFNENTNFKHNQNKKIRLTQYHKKNLQDELKTKKPLTVKNLLVNKLMETGDSEPTFVPSLHTLQQLKHATKQSNFLHPSPILSTWSLAFTPPYDKCIRKICLFPFFLLYWTPEQSSFIEYYIKSQKYVKVSIDATGSILKKISVPDVNVYTQVQNKNRKHIFLYVLMCYRDSGSSVPLCQMLSELNTLDNIANFLKEWLDGKAVPNECVTDDSSALLGAVSKAFNGFSSTNAYIDRCFELLEARYNKMGFVESHIPPCYMRLDKSHFIKNLYKQAVFDHVDPRVKFFYIKSLLLLRQTENYDDVKKILQLIVTIACNRYGGLTDKNTLSRCASSLTQLQNLLINVENPQETSTEDVTSDFINLENITDPTVDNALCSLCDIIEKRETLYNESVKKNLDDENMYFFPTIIKLLKRLIKKIPLWGEVMNTFYPHARSSPSSSNVENYFKDIKTNFINPKDSRLRLDEFIQLHVPQIQGTLKSAIATEKAIEPCESTMISKIANNLTVMEDSTFTKESVFLESPVTTENWKGQMSSETKELKQVHILKNGSLVPSYTSNVEVFNTCAFDCIFQSLAVGVVDRSKIKAHAIRAKSNLICKFILSLASGSPDPEIYKNRTAILLQNQNPQEIPKSGPYLINCVTSSSNIIQTIIFPIYHSAIREKKCLKARCRDISNILTKLPYIPIDENIIKDKGITSLNLSINNSIKKEKGTCSNCNSPVIYNYYFQNILFMELSSTETNNIDNIPIEITVKKQKYTLLAVIEFIPGGIGHFRTWCYRKKSKTWQCFDDLQNLDKLPDTQIIVYNLIYTV